MRSRLVLLPILVVLSLAGPALALPYSSLALSTTSDMAPLLEPESGLPSDPFAEAIFAAARLLNDQGIADLSSKQQSRAEGNFTRAIALAPKAWALYNNRATAYASRANYSAALRDIDTALQLSPDNVLLLARRSAIYVATKKLDKAKADLNRAVDIAPKNPVVLARRAMLHLYLDDRAAAQADLAMAISIDPSQSEVLRADEFFAREAKAEAPKAQVTATPVPTNTALENFIRARKTDTDALLAEMRGQ